MPTTTDPSREDDDVPAARCPRCGARTAATARWCSLCLSPLDSSADSRADSRAGSRADSRADSRAGDLTSAREPATAGTDPGGVDEHVLDAWMQRLRVDGEAARPAWQVRVAGAPRLAVAAGVMAVAVAVLALLTGIGAVV